MRPISGPTGGRLVVSDEPTPARQRQPPSTKYQPVTNHSRGSSLGVLCSPQLSLSRLVPRFPLTCSISVSFPHPTVRTRGGEARRVQQERPSAVVHGGGGQAALRRVRGRPPLLQEGLLGRHRRKGKREGRPFLYLSLGSLGETEI